MSTPSEMASAGTKMGKAKAALVLEQPFFASILCTMPMVPDDTLVPPTMATNGKWFRYHPEFVNSMTLDEVKFVLCHEVGHCVFQHMFRRGQREHKRWNQAGDYIINDMLIKEQVGTMPSGAMQGLHNPQLVAAGGGTTDGVYDLLPPDPDGNGNGHGDPLDNCIDADGSAADKSAAEAEMAVRIAQAAQAAKMCGKLSANMRRFVDDALEPKVDWRDVLRRFVSAKAKTEYSYARPKRRFVNEDIYLPSLAGEKLGEVVVFVDCSGSIGAPELAEFAAEIKAVKQDCLPEKMHVVYFDSAVCHHDVFDQDTDVHVEAHGGGGTDFAPLWPFVDSVGAEPVCGIVLTDLDCGSFGTPPGYPVLWITTNSTTAPWGEIVEMRPKL